jgi:succinate dehydrogenase / fumarate reductase cytochrome b subunit
MTKVEQAPRYDGAPQAAPRRAGAPFLIQFWRSAIGKKWVMAITGMMRGGLLTAVVLHIWAAVSLTRMNHAARPVKYQSKRDYVAANYAARTMRWTGVIVLLFIIFHLLDLTFGKTDDAFVSGEVYDNIVASFDRPLVAVFYIAANLALAFHLFHGTWSMFQSLGWNNPRWNALRRKFAIGITAIIAIGNISIPLAVMTGVVK